MNQTLTVYKASAGSGKTFTLTIEYILLLLQDEQGAEFQHTLAVTFTNKATAEMKDRILQSLYGLACDLPSSKKYLKAIHKRLQEMGVEMDDATIRRRAGNALSAILHGFDYFRVETIDSFFQSILRNLAHELRLTANLQVELNNDQVTALAVDRIVDNLQDNPSIKKWILDYVHSQLEEEGKWNIISALKDFAKCIYDESFQDRTEEDRKRLNDEQLIREFKKTMFLLEETEKNKLKNRVKEIRQTIDNQTLNSSKISNWGTYESFLNKVERFDKPEFGKRLENTASNPEEMLKVKDRSNPDLLSQTAPTIQLFVDLKNQYDISIHIINSAKLSRQNVNPLRLLSTIEDEITRINTENNQFNLSKTPVLLKQLQTSDTPFIYEKTGTWFHNIMIDEFQDTSRLQWQNFKTLLINDQATGGHDLLVGDVKQSIYRWRNGDWRILNGIKEEFNWIKPKLDELKTNWRSRYNIIDFNNKFFKRAAELIDEVSDNPQFAVKDIYKDVKQEFNSTQETGYVRTRIYMNQKDSAPIDYDENMAKDMIDQIHRLTAMGLPLRKIAILVRKKDSGVKLIEAFHRLDKDIPLVSDEAFLLDASLSIQMMVNALKVLSGYQNSLVSMRYLTLHYLQDILRKGEEVKTDDYINCQPADILPSEFITQQESLARMPLYLLCERLYQIFDLDTLEGQEPYLYTFYDELQKYLLKSPSDLHSFLKAWDTTISSCSIPSGEIDGIRILTIHKSKGLQFHTVLIPYCDWTIERIDNQMWCRPSQAPFNQLGLLRVNTSRNDFKNSIFNSVYTEECMQTRIDNINLLYVAFTRAENNLFIWGRSNGTYGTNSIIGDLIFAGLGMEMEDNGEDETSSEEVTMEVGTPVIEYRKESESDNRMAPDYEPIQIPLQSSPPTLDFQQSNESRKFIHSLDEDDKENHGQTYLEIGKMMHYVLSQVESIHDISPTLYQCRIAGLIQNEEMQQNVLAAINNGLSNPTIASWFSDQNEVINESAITHIDPKTGLPHVARPDRVIRRDDKITVIDYKFANSRTTHRAEEYKEQVQLYIQLLHQMNPTLSVKGYLWYIYDNAVVEVPFQKEGGQR